MAESPDVEHGVSALDRAHGMRLAGKPIAAERKYKVAGWAPVAEGAKGEPIWEVVTKYLQDRKTIAPVKGAGGVSTAASSAEATYAWGWARNIWAEALV